MKLPTKPLGSPAALSSLSIQPRAAAVYPRNRPAITPAPIPATTAAPAAPTSRSYATQQQQGSGPKPGAKRRAVTPFNDDGAVHWSQLSGGEKAARATGQSVNFGLVLVGIAMTGGVAYFLFTDVIDTESKTAWFNRAVGRIKKDPTCLSLLGDASKISAHGDETGNKWRRARPITSSTHKDSQGIEHLLLRFFVEGPLNSGIVNVHLVRRQGDDEFVYKYLALDVKGHQRIYLENADTNASSNDKKFKLFGVKWG